MPNIAYGIEYMDCHALGGILVSTEENAETILEIAGAVKRYGSLTALDGVDLRIAHGQYVGLLGPNGAGKSTLFQIVVGLFGQDAGAVELFGATHSDAGAAIRRRLGVVFQARSIDLDMSIRANLRFHGRLFGLGGRELETRIEDLSTRLGLSGMTGRLVRQLSGGQQRKVEIARALLNQPDLLIMDEATAGLDAASRRALVNDIQTLTKQDGVAVLWATHLVDEIAEADEIVVLNHGKVVATGTPVALIAETGASDLVGAYEALTSTEAAT